jgi:SAM-dependent methyltransferase
VGDASIDKAVSLNSLYFWPDPEAAFAELARVLRPGGLLVIGFEPPEELAKWRGSRFGFRAFAQGEVEALLRSAGFAPIEAAEGRGRRPDRFLILSAKMRHANG